MTSDDITEKTKNFRLYFQAIGKRLALSPFSYFFEKWGLDVKDIIKTWANKGDSVVENEVQIDYVAVILVIVTKYVPIYNHHERYFGKTYKKRIFSKKQ